ncbi:hypothetical protein AB1Y20_001350 [Prymnesium parvum]|uniref:C2 domain-containing protein n=1 Tax=Prymnesium parvum TaxID=97485 RepID=A0AB34KB62_PRYPA
MPREERDSRELHDEVARLREENSSLKRFNMEQSDKVKQLSAQMVRIQKGLHQQAVPKDVPPTTKARVAKDLTKEDRIAELEFELNQRDAREMRMAQQLTYFKSVAGSGAAAHRGAPGHRRLAAASSIQRRAMQSKAVSQHAPPSTVIGNSDQTSMDGVAPKDRSSEDAEGADYASLLAMLQDKDRELADLRAQLSKRVLISPVDAGNVCGGATCSATAASALGACAVASDPGHVFELRRLLKDRMAQLALLTQKYDRLSARFETVRDNHEKVLAKMSDLNRVIRDEGSENAKLRQEVQQLQLLQDELQEKSFQLEHLRTEKESLEDENRRILAKALSHEEASEVTKAKQELGMKEQELKRLRQKLASTTDRAKIVAEANATAEARLATAHAERDNAKRAQAKLHAELSQKGNELAQLEKHVALLVGDTGVAPQDLERALNFLRESNALEKNAGAEEASLRLQPTDLDTLGLTPLARRQVMEILAQNAELIRDVEKAEQLLHNSERMNKMLEEDVKAAKLTSNEEATRLRKALAQRTQELTEAKRSVLQLQDQLSSLHEQHLASRHGRGHRDRTVPLLPINDSASVTDSVISEGVESALDVATDENIFELRIMYAKLEPSFFDGLPSTFVSFDFFQHDTQATPMRQGLDPTFDFTAQYVLTVDDLFLHYAATSVLSLELNRSWGAECQLVAKSEAPLRELLQGRSGTIQKFAQLFAVPANAYGTNGPDAVGSIVYEMRMRRDMSAVVHSFMQRFPEVATLALTPVSSGTRSNEVVVTIKSCIGLKLRAHGLQPAPYVHFEFFDYGEQETYARNGRNPVFDQDFRFPVNLEKDFYEVIKQGTLRFSVFDENEDDTEVALGFASLPLADLLHTSMLEKEVQLFDINGQPAGSLVLNLKLHQLSQPKPIRLRIVAKEKGDLNPYCAAVKIQRVHRGRSARKQFGQHLAAEAAAPLVVSVHQILIDPSVRASVIGPVWVEIDLFGLHVTGTKSTQLKPGDAEREVGFKYTLPIKSGSSEAETLCKALLGTEEESDVFFCVRGITATGSTQIGVGFVNLKELYSTGFDLSKASVTLKGADQRHVGEIVASLSAVEAIHRSISPTTIRLCVGALELPVDVTHDTNLTDLFVEIDMLGLLPTNSQRTRVISTHSQGGFGYSVEVQVPPASQAMAVLRKSLEATAEEKSDLYFVLKAVQPQTIKHSTKAHEREIAKGHFNLRALLRARHDVIGHRLSLRTRAGGAATLSITLLAFEAIRRIQIAQTTTSGIRLDVGELTLLEPFRSDPTIDKMWIEIDPLDLNGTRPMKTTELSRAANVKYFGFSQVISVEKHSQEQVRLKAALAAADDQESDVYFTLKARHTQRDQELAKGFVNLKGIAKANKDHEDAPIDLVTAQGKVAGQLQVTVAALSTLHMIKETPEKSRTLQLTIGILELATNLSRDANVVDVWVEVDLLGLADASQLRTKRLHKSAPSLDFGFSTSIAVDAGSKQEAALRTALASAHEQDADVYFVVKTRTARNEDREIGQGYVNLQSLLRDGRDAVSTSVSLQGKTGSAGSVTVSLVALEALRSVSGEVPSARGRRPAVDSASVRVEVGALTLSPSVQRDPEVTDVWVEVDLLGLADASQLRTKRLHKSAPSLDFGFSTSIAVGAGSKQEAALRTALASAHEQDADVYFVVKTRTARNEEREIGQGYVNLQSLLRDGRDAVSTSVSLQGKTGSAGSVTVSLVALEALRSVPGEVSSARGRRPAVDSASVRVEVGALTLSPSVQRDPEVTDVWLEVDLLGLADASQLRTKRLHKSAPSLDFGFSTSIAVGAGSKQEAALRTALASAHEQDADVYFVVKTRTARNEEREIGQGYVNLQSLLRDGRDAVSTSVSLQGKTGSAGSVTVSLVALEALRSVSGEVSSARGREPAVDSASVRVEVGALTLSPSVQRDPEVTDVWVEVDLLGLADASQLRTKRLHKSAPSLDFGFSTSIAVGAGSKQEAALRTALASAHEQDADVYFVVKTRTARNEEREIGQGYVNLQSLLRDGRDAVSTSVSLQGKKGSAGSVTVSLVALEALRSVSGEVSSARGRRPAVDSASVRVEVGALTLSPSVQRDPEVTDVWVEVDLLGLADASQLRTKRLHKSAPSLDFGFSTSIAVDAGSKQEAALRTALASAHEQDADVYFVVKTRTARNEEREIGQGYVNLQSLLRDGRDAVSTSVSLQGKTGSAGSVTVSLMALEALRSVSGEVPSARGREPAVDSASVRVEVGALTLSPSVQRDPEVTDVWLEVDLLGLADASQLRTKRLHKSAPSLDFGFSTSIAVGAGSKQEAALRTALASAHEQDADVYFVVKTRTARNEEREIGQGYVNLQSLLRDGRDAVSTSVSLQGKTGSAGSVTVSLVALEALRSVSGEVSSTRGRRPAVDSASVRVEVGALTLSPSVQRDPEVTDVWVEVDLLGLADASQLRTKRLHKSAPSLDFGFSTSIAVDAGSKQEAALRTALASAHEQDADVYFVVKTRTARNEEREIGQGYVNLQSLLRDGRDAVSTSVSLQGKTGSAGSVTVSLVALEALRSVSGEVSSARGRRPAVDSASVRVEVGALTLSPSVQRDPEVTDVWLEVDLLGLADASQLRTKRLHKSAPSLDFGFSTSIAVGAGSKQEAALRTALASAHEQDADVYFVVKTRTARNEEREIGQGYVNLQSLLRDGRDAVSTSVSLQGKTGSAGSVTVSLVALEALRSVSGEVSSARGREPAVDSASVRVEVGALTLSPSVQRDPEVTDVWLEVDLLGLADASQLRTKRLHKSAPSLDFGFSTSIAVGAGSKQEAALRTALASAHEQDADVYFVVKTRTARNEEREIGQGYVNLQSLLRDGRDAVSTSVSLQGKTGSAGSVTVSLVALQVNATFKVPFSRTEHSRTREDLLRAMRFGDRSSADVRVSLCYYESGVGGEEGLELAVGLINLRDIWAQKEDLMHQQVSLLEEGLEETSSITMSSSVIYPLTQLLNP